MSPEEEFLDRMGQIAHEAYCKWANVKPVWDKVGEGIKDGWRVAAKAVLEEYQK